MLIMILNAVTATNIHKLSQPCEPQTSTSERYQLLNETHEELSALWLHSRFPPAIDLTSPDWLKDENYEWQDEKCRVAGHVYHQLTSIHWARHFQIEWKSKMDDSEDEMADYSQYMQYNDRTNARQSFDYYLANVMQKYSYPATIVKQCYYETGSLYSRTPVLSIVHAPGHPVDVPCFSCDFRMRTLPNIKQFWIVNHRDHFMPFHSIDAINPMYDKKQFTAGKNTIAQAIYWHHVERHFEDVNINFLPQKGMPLNEILQPYEENTCNCNDKQYITKEEKLKCEQSNECSKKNLQKYRAHYIADQHVTELENRLFINADPTGVGEYLPYFNAMTLTCIEHNLESPTTPSLFINIDTLVPSSIHQRAQLNKNEPTFFWWKLADFAIGRIVRRSNSKLKYFNLKRAYRAGFWSCYNACCYTDDRLKEIMQYNELNRECKTKLVSYRRRTNHCILIKIDRDLPLYVPEKYLPPMSNGEKINCDSAWNNGGKIPIACQWRRLDELLSIDPYRQSGIECYSSILADVRLNGAMQIVRERLDLDDGTLGMHIEVESKIGVDCEEVEACESIDLEQHELTPLDQEDDDEEAPINTKDECRRNASCLSSRQDTINNCILTLISNLTRIELDYHDQETKIYVNNGTSYLMSCKNQRRPVEWQLLRPRLNDQINVHPINLNMILNHFSVDFPMHQTDYLEKCITQQSRVFKVEGLEINNFMDSFIVYRNVTGTFDANVLVKCNFWVSTVNRTQPHNYERSISLRFHRRQLTTEESPVTLIILLCILILLGLLAIFILVHRRRAAIKRNLRIELREKMYDELRKMKTVPDNCESGETYKERYRRLRQKYEQEKVGKKSKEKMTHQDEKE